MNPLELIAQAHRAGPGMTLERLLTSPSGFGLTTASPLQRAICRLSEGLPLAELDIPAIRGRFSSAPTCAPTEVVLLAGIRTAKSLIAGAQAVKASQTCNVSKLSPGEIPRVSVVSTVKDNADVILNHIVGNVKARASLQRLLIEEPSGDSVMLRHPSGRPVEIRVVAGSRAGHTLVARWSAGVIFDEAPRMVGQGDGVVNLDDCRAAILGRMLEGAQIWYIGSPWAPFGPVWEMVQAPGPGVLVVRAPAYEMWPAHWTSERCEELRRRDPTVHRTDVEAEFADPESSLFNSVDIVACERKTLSHVQPAVGHEYFAAMDPATRGNAWTLIIVTRDRAGKLIVCWNQEWIGSKVMPLKPRTVLAEITRVCRGYRIGEVWSDQWGVDALRDIAEAEGLNLVSRRSDTETTWNRYQSLAARLADRQIELPPDPTLRADLLAVRRRVTQQGTTITLPVTANGRHCDYAPALTLALAAYLGEPGQLPPAKGSPEAWEKLERDEEQREADEMQKAEKRPMWGDSDDDDWATGT